MSNPSNEIQIAVMAEQLKTCMADLLETRRDIAALQEERNKALKWGVMSLGTAVMGMAYWIFNAVTGGHLK